MGTWTVRESSKDLKLDELGSGSSYVGWHMAEILTGVLNPVTYTVLQVALCRF